VDLDVAPDPGRLPQEVETARFRIVQEAPSSLHRQPGSGLRSNAKPGIARMRERVQQFGGGLDIGSANGGTMVRANIPLSRVGV
jgi:signal transduction histidine kinase